MKSIRKIVSLALAFLLLSSLMSTVLAAGIDSPFIPVPDENDGEIQIGFFYYSLNGSSATVTGYAGWQTDIAIPRTVEYDGVTYTVDAIGESAFTADNALTSIAVPKSVASIGKNAFWGCTRLADVWFEGSNAEQSGMTFADGNSAFSGATWHYNACITRPDADKSHLYDNSCDRDCNVCAFVRDTAEHVYDGDRDITCNVCGAMRIVPGDVDENNTVTQDDAIYLLFYIYFPEDYPINSYHDPDYDKDGDTDMDDAFYLLYHAYFPERFPIEIKL